MTGPLLEKRRRLPMRECSLCSLEKAVLQLARVGERWLCAPCYREHVAHARKPEGKARSRAGAAAGEDVASGGAGTGALEAASAAGTAEGARSPEAVAPSGTQGGPTAAGMAVAAATGAKGAGQRQPDPNLLWSLHVVDASFRYGALVVRLLVYGALYALAENTGFGPHLMAGFLLADGITWMFTAFFDLRFHRLAVVAETVFFGVMFWLWLQTGWSFPDHPADRAILGLAALATFTAKTAALATKLTR